MCGMEQTFACPARPTSFIFPGNHRTLQYKRVEKPSQIHSSTAEQNHSHRTYLAQSISPPYYKSPKQNTLQTD
jgi:hypothetical protein